MRSDRVWLAALACAAVGASAGTAAVNLCAAERPAMYRAVYDTYYRQRRIGETEFSVTPAAGAVADIGTHAGADAGADAEANGHPGPDTATDAEADSGTATDTDSGADAEANAPAETADDIAANGNPANPVYEFRSVSRFVGLARLLAPRPVEESSEFVYMNGSGEIQPLRYSFRDGTRRGNGNFGIEFDWDRGRATVTTNDLQTETEIPAGALDRGSLQVMLMARGRDFVPGQWTLIDEDGLETHELRDDGHEVVETPAGSFEARKLIQRRLGSSRRTLIWLAPDLDYLPVRIERQTDGETRVTLRLASARWPDRPAAPSSLR